MSGKRVVTRRKPTPYETEAVAMLSYVTMLPGSFDKRFVRRLDATLDVAGLSEKESAQVWRLVWRYRVQIRAKFSTCSALNNVMALAEMRHMESK